MPLIKNTIIAKTKQGQSTPPSSAIKIGAGFRFSAYINNAGKVYQWGGNDAGQLGDNTTTNKSSPVLIAGALKTFCHIALGKNPFAGYAQTNAIDKNGRAWGWGSNAAFNHNGTGATRSTPVTILGVTKTFCKIDAGNAFTQAIDKNGKVWGWGSGNSGRLGNNQTVNYASPVSIAGANKTFCHISCGGAFALGIDKNGRAWGWGFNGQGNLGDNSITSRNTPVSVAGVVKTFCRIAVNNESSVPNCFTLALDKNGRAWAWGYNVNGQLGDTTTISKRTPVSVRGAVKTFCKISAGAYHSLAIDKNGRLWAWGLNTNGELGDNSVTSRLTPVSVLGLVKTFCEVIAGTNHSLAIDKNGKVWAWGLNVSGELGDKTTTTKRTPVSVVVL